MVLRVVPPEGPEAMLDLLKRLQADVESGELTGLVTVEVRDGHPSDGSDGSYRVGYSWSNLLRHEAHWCVAHAQQMILEGDE